MVEDPWEKDRADLVQVRLRHLEKRTRDLMVINIVFAGLFVITFVLHLLARL